MAMIIDLYCGLGLGF